jgi:hypothetical protein
MTRTKQILIVMSNKKPWSTTKLAKAMGITEIEAARGVACLRNSLSIRPGPRTGGHSRYTITEQGLEIAAKVQGLPKPPKVNAHVSSMVSQAIRTQPTSVFNLGAM